MRCLSSRFSEPAAFLADGTSAMQHIIGNRSLLPPSPTADQLLLLLRESGYPCTSLTAPDSNAGVLGWPPASFSAASITRQCPTSRRVASTFAAAGAHSMLGEMLQFFAESVTRLFTSGVADPSVRAFPSEWDRRLHAPAAASLRQHHLYELQGFSTLFTYIWGQVATSLPLLREQNRDGQGLVDSTECDVVSSTLPAMCFTRGASAKAPAAQQPPSRPLPMPASTAAARQSQPFHRAPNKGSSDGPNSGSAVAHVHPCIPLTSATLFLPDVEAAPIHCIGKRQKDGPLSAVLSRSAVQPAALAVVQHALTAHAKAQGPFQPSIPREGLVPSSSPREDERLHPQNSSAVSAHAPRSLESAPSHLIVAQTLSVEKAMQLDRQRELRRELGVRRVRNYAAESDMRDYLASFQANMRSLLEIEDVAAGDGG
ncbi:conserved hypothetical protein [Leishmania braziliensis MHOM/BR/75/M2904]|uniref:Uncharacterized protein n=1 Tax=Leishmania braziliensis TaxID=5660 RepID=A4HPS7_LEIBR|nr:conserved hypothetical protein [Leishmania braziliensis MHOM/BR/75/M2904]CAJ2481810.1 unnamed protein product [Leishmania braziliensis]CAM44185.1 conserved hypothetical protein [Leishmania braziliensis MHOM/BR/75/M2904]